VFSRIQAGAIKRKKPPAFGGWRLFDAAKAY